MPDRRGGCHDPAARRARSRINVANFANWLIVGCRLGEPGGIGRAPQNLLLMKLKSLPATHLLKRQAEVFKALGHPGRMAIVHTLGEGPVCACELAEVAGCTPSTASRHLAVLRQAGAD